MVLSVLKSTILFLCYRRMVHHTSSYPLCLPIAHTPRPTAMYSKTDRWHKLPRNSPHPDMLVLNVAHSNFQQVPLRNQLVDMQILGHHCKQIELLLQKLSTALSNRHGPATLAALPHWLLPQASLTRGSAAGLSSVSLQGFMTQRAHLLMGERLLGFEEQTVEQRIEVFGRVAQAWLRYRRSGQMDGTQISGEGFKSLQLLKTEAGWKIASLAWQDLP